MKRMLGVLGLLLLAGCSDVPVRGFVRDDTTGAPLPGATVRVGDEETKSDSNGFYSIDVDDDEDAAQRMYVTHEGYVPATQRVKVEDDDQDEVHMDVGLQKAGPGAVR
jgi:hypothetical protein